eukprot:TRINITY_DN1398_c0_g1_i3.p1 TRINITY_DN1398_c0_g1~~TRINITY_DN1398_c0_g1_i3.p1  ORF type:complete len:190 (+),score=12.07 TRINITY_DN1398_c0_g1_i3:1468-2037(+)
MQDKGRIQRNLTLSDGEHQGIKMVASKLFGGKNMSAVVASTGNGEMLRLMFREHTQDIAFQEKELHASIQVRLSLVNQLEECRRSLAFHITLNKGREQVLAAEVRLHQELLHLKSQHAQCAQMQLEASHEYNRLKVHIQLKVCCRCKSGTGLLYVACYMLQKKTIEGGENILFSIMRHGFHVRRPRKDW